MRPVQQGLGLDITDWVSQLSVTVTKCLRESSYKEERFIMAHGFGGSNP